MLSNVSESQVKCLTKLSSNASEIQVKGLTKASSNILCLRGKSKV